MSRSFGTLIGPQGEKWRMASEAKPSGSFGERFVVVFPERLAALASDPNVQGAAFRVLLWCWEHLSFEAWRMVRQADIAEALAVSEQSVGRGLAQLLERGMLERRGSGPRQEWRLTPDAGWMGTPGRYHKARRERGENPAGLVLVDGGAE